MHTRHAISGRSGARPDVGSVRSRRSFGLATLRSVGFAALAPALTLGIVGCSGTFDPDGQRPSPSSPATVASPSPESARYSASAGARDNLAAVRAALVPLHRDGAVPTSTEAVDALNGIGVPNDVMQVTSEQTPTGLDADQISISVEFRDACVIGNFLPDDVVVEVQDKVNGACLIGETQEIGPDGPVQGARESPKSHPPVDGRDVNDQIPGE